MAITAAKLLVEVDADTSQAESGLDSFGKKVNNMAKTGAMAGGILTATVTAPLLGIATAAVKSAASFEQNMNVLQQAAGATSADMAGLQDQALKLGKSTVFSANEAAEGMLELAKAGMDTTQVMDAIPGVLNLAAAGGVSVAEAASLTASTLNAFNLEASESVRIADLMAATAGASAADITDLGQGMKQAGFAFKLANQPVENLAASLAFLTNNGLTGSDAGTALKNTFMRMMNPTQEASDIMAELGINFYDASGQMKQLPDIIDMLNTSMQGLTDQQRDAALTNILMSDGMKAMVPLMEAGRDGFNEMVGTVTEVGFAAKMADALMGGLSGGIEALTGSAETFMTSQALPFLDTLNGIALAAADAIDWFGALPQPVIDTSLAFLGLLLAAGPVLLILSGVTAAITALTTPVGLTILAVLGLAAAAVALGYAWSTNLGDIQGITESVMTPVQEAFNATLVSAQALADGITTAFSKTKFPSLDALWADFKAGDFEMIANKIRTATIELTANLETELNISGNISKLKEQLSGMVNSLSATIDGIDFGKGSGAISDMITNLTKSINELDFSGIQWGTVLKAGLVGPIIAAISGINWVISSAEFSGLVTAVKGAFGEIKWADLGNAFAGLGAAVTTQLGKVATDMATEIGGLFSGVGTGVSMPKIDIDWGQLTIDTSGLIKSVTDSIKAADWASVGASVGEKVADLGIVIATAVGAAIMGVNWAAEMANSLRAQMVGIGIKIGYEIGLALREVNILDDLTQLQISIKAAFAKALIGAGAEIGEKLNIDWTPIANIITSSFTEIDAALKESLRTAMTNAGTEMDAFDANFNKSLASAFQNANGKVTGFDANFNNAMTSAFANADAKVSDFNTTLNNSFATMVSNVTTTIEPLITTVSETFSSIASSINGAIQSIRDALSWLGGLGSEGIHTGAGLMPPLGPTNPSGGLGMELFPQEGQSGPQGGKKGRYSLRPSASAAAVAQEPLVWDNYVKPLLWETFVLPLEWSTHVVNLVWDTFINVIEWESFITVITWSTFIPNLIWDSFVTIINWSNYITDINWGNYVPSLGWGDYVPDLDWGRFIPALRLGTGAPDIPTNAAGSPYFRGGLSWVGERGPELVSLPRGSRIHSNQDSMAMAGSGITVNVNVASLANDMDVEAMANRIARVMQRKIR